MCFGNLTLHQNIIKIGNIYKLFTNAELKLNLQFFVIQAFIIVKRSDMKNSGKANSYLMHYFKKMQISNFTSLLQYPFAYDFLYVGVHFCIVIYFTTVQS